MNPKLYFALDKQNLIIFKFDSFYEIVKEEKLAVKEYEYLLNQDSIFYQKCKFRIDELAKESPNHLKEIIYSDDRKRVFFHIDGLKI